MRNFLERPIRTQLVDRILFSLNEIDNGKTNKKMEEQVKKWEENGRNSKNWSTPLNGGWVVCF